MKTSGLNIIEAIELAKQGHLVQNDLRPVLFEIELADDGSISTFADARGEHFTYPRGENWYNNYISGDDVDLILSSNWKIAGSGMSFMRALKLAKKGTKMIRKHQTTLLFVDGKPNPSLAAEDFEANDWIVAEE
jgi:hypothetical protein